MSETPASDADHVLRPPARLTLFGFGSTEADLTVRRRSTAWRLTRTLRIVVATAVVAPLVGLVPPHAPWILGALGGGIYLARRRWTHRFSVLDLTARCPRCGSGLTLPAGTRLRAPHPISCEACHHQPTLELPGDALPAR